MASYAGGEHGTRQGTLQSKMDARRKRSLEARPHGDPPGTPPHNHNDPTTKNPVSRSCAAGAGTPDRSTFLTGARARVGVAAERTLKAPRLEHVRVMQK